MLNIRTHVDIAPLTSFRIGGKAFYLTEINVEADIAAVIAFAQENALPLHILGYKSCHLQAIHSFRLA